MTSYAVTDRRVTPCYEPATRACDLARVMPPTTLGTKLKDVLATLSDVDVSAWLGAGLA